ncbi:F-box/kelch-repeat protein At3g23880-like [Apium graveolens]|uniref:F-box/kelch-repeat protein At3g23880-like n=1 Tax=Apium graveolens TaxID=4045 RepID=UPI003D7A9392
MATNPLCQYLPEEIIQQILVKIPCTKSILRCTLVCKLWYFLIKSSRFINTHLSSPNNRKYLLCQSYPDGYSDSLYSLYSDFEPYGNCVTSPVFPRGLKHKHVKVHGCCNGVICYTETRKNRGIYLWNPFVRKLKIIPMFVEEHYREGVEETFGFCFDEEKSDYQVLKMNYTSVTSLVAVYSLRSNSWKIISDSCPGARFPLRGNNVVYTKGTLLWLSEESQGCKVVALNMNNAMFREALISYNNFQPSLGIWGFGSWYLKLDANFLVILSRVGLCVCTVKVHDDSLELLYTDVADQSLGNHSSLLGLRNTGEALFHTVQTYSVSATQKNDSFV